jgi:hypothetical protein
MPSVTMIPALARWERPLAEAGQSHVLRFAGELSEAQQASLAAQIEGIDLPGLAKLIKKYVLQPEAAADLGVDLVEHQQRHAILVRQRLLDREHDAREFAA